jgi:hypothetical protein
MKGGLLFFTDIKMSESSTKLKICAIRLNSLQNIPSSVPRSEKVEKLLGSASEETDTIAMARAMPEGDTQEGFVKNVFKIMKNLRIDDLCHHGLIFYTCVLCRK